MSADNIPYRVSLAGMIKAQHLARKFKLRAVFLVAEKKKRENCGHSHVEHQDEPSSAKKISFLDEADQNQGQKQGTAVSRLATLATYRLEPRNRFYEPDVRMIIRKVFEANLDGRAYDSEYCKKTATFLSDLIKQQVKALNFERYKIICLVYLGQVMQQGLRISSLCLFDGHHDNYAEYRHTDQDVFAVGVVYGFYME